MTLLRWWFVFFVSIFSTAGAGYMGLLTRLWQIDQTRLSFVILGVYFCTSAFIGWCTYVASNGEEERAREHINLIDEAGDVCMKIAIAGTTVGFSIMVQGAFSHGIVATPEALAGMASGLSLIYLVTAVGVVASMLLGLQAVNLRYVVSE